MKINLAQERFEIAARLADVNATSSRMSWCFAVRVRPLTGFRARSDRRYDPPE